MGEVYRADDLKLGQPVALKFLPATLEEDETQRARLFQEVRTARQVSHPNVCRVYDIGEAEGRHFLTMEYVDGEDVASLLRRIGRLPLDKAVQVARQLCAGLAAAHQQGILHRDLKPANVMIDGQGRVRITDFGLAGLVGELHGRDVRAGTPAYMAPEQLAGKEVSVRSDVYSLGLVLYEIFTGRPAHQALTREELGRLHRDTAPKEPSGLVEGMDPAIERAILRCLEKESGHRPASALAVAALLPGGDPLAAALEAGETPSPEMVAAAGEEGSLRRSAGLACLVFTLVGTGVLALLAGKVSLSGKVPLEKPPDVLADRAGDVVRRLGYREAPADRAHGFGKYQSYLRYVAEHDESLARWEHLAGGHPTALFFWYRQSPRYLAAYNPSGRVGLEDPPASLSGMVTVYLDTRGRLWQLHAVPPQFQASSGPWPSPDWSALFAEAGLDPAGFTATEPKWVPAVYADSRAAWEGVHPQRPELRLRVEAAAYHGRPVYFEVLGPWSKPLRMEPLENGGQGAVAEAIAAVVLLLILLMGVLLARRNLRMGRGDRGGAFKLGLYFFLTHTLVWVLAAHHVPSVAREVWGNLLPGLGEALSAAGFVWLLYIALEPYVRRMWPDRIISWSRLLVGRLRDPLVGRDLLVGGVFGVASALLVQLHYFVPPWIGLPPPIPMETSPGALLGFRQFIADLLEVQLYAVQTGMALLFILVLVRGVLRAQWAAVGAFFLLFMVIWSPDFQSSYPYVDLGLRGLTVAMFTIVLIRYGLLATMVHFFVAGVLTRYAITVDPSAWYAGASWLALLAVVAVAAHGFYASLGGRPLFEGELLRG